jgi:hypothetical protein
MSVTRGDSRMRAFLPERRVKRLHAAKGSISGCGSDLRTDLRSRAAPGGKASHLCRVPALVPSNQRLGQAMHRELVRHALFRGRLRGVHAGCGRDKVELTHPCRDQCDVAGIDRDAEAGARFHGTFVLGSIEAFQRGRRSAFTVAAARLPSC